MSERRPEPPRRPRCSAARGLVKFYPDGHVQALRGVSLDINEAESVAITGPSGCGKSTLLHILGGLDRPTEGDVFFRGNALSQLDIDAFRATRGRLRLPVLLSDANPDRARKHPDPDVRGALAARRAHPPRRAPDRGSRPRGPQRHHRPAQLSVGQRQRVAIARALANDPSLLLADEPTGNLDSKSQDEIIQLLHRLRDSRKLTLVIVTHSHEVAQAADRQIRMKDGQIQTPAS